MYQFVGTVAADEPEAIERMKAEACRRIEAESKQLPVLPPEPGLLAKLAELYPSERPVFGVDHGSCDPEGFASVGVHSGLQGAVSGTLAFVHCPKHARRPGWTSTIAARCAMAARWFCRRTTVVG